MLFLLIGVADAMPCLHHSNDQAQSKVPRDNGTGCTTGLTRDGPGERAAEIEVDGKLLARSGRRC